MEGIRSKGRKIFSKAKRLLRLGNWRIKIIWEDNAGYAAYGAFNANDERPEADLHLWTRINTEAELKDTILHELIHAPFARLDSLVLRHALTVDDENERKRFCDDWERERDWVVDAFTQILKPHL